MTSFMPTYIHIYIHTYTYIHSYTHISIHGCILHYSTHHIICHNAVSAYQHYRSFVTISSFTATTVIDVQTRSYLNLDLDLVWSVHPAYGGSHYGIKPLSKTIVPDTSDVTLDNTQIKTHEIPDKHDKKKKDEGKDDLKLEEESVESSAWLYFWVILTCLLMMMMATYICYSRYHKQYSHNTIHSTSQHHSSRMGYTIIPDTHM